MNQRLSEGLAQTRVDHPNACTFLDMCVDIILTPNLNIFVFHVLEAIDKDVDQPIEESALHGEAKLRTFLVHTAQALIYAHSEVAATQGIAYRNVKPASIFQTAAGEYKMGDFGALWKEKRMWDEEMRSYPESGMKQTCRDWEDSTTPSRIIYMDRALLRSTSQLSPAHLLQGNAAAR